MLKAVRILFALVVVCCALSFVAQSDIEEATRQGEIYCANVADGTWPDYERRYAKDCKDGEAKKF